MEILLSVGIAFVVGMAMLGYLEHCKHEFVELKSFVTESEAEQLVRLHYKPTNLTNTRKNYVTILQCTKCHKIKKIVVTND